MSNLTTAPAGPEKCDVKDALVALRAEIQRLALMSADAENAIGEFSGLTLIENSPSIQRLDAVRQNLHGLATYISSLIDNADSKQCLDPHLLVKSVTPRDLAERLLSPEKRPLDYVSGDLDLF